MCNAETRYIHTHTHAYTYEFAIYSHFLPNAVVCSGMKETKKKQRPRNIIYRFYVWNTEKTFMIVLLFGCASMTMTTSQRHCCHASYRMKDSFIIQKSKNKSHVKYTTHTATPINRVWERERAKESGNYLYWIYLSLWYIKFAKMNVNLRSALNWMGQNYYLHTRTNRVFEQISIHFSSLLCFVLHKNCGCLNI